MKYLGLWRVCTVITCLWTALLVRIASIPYHARVLDGWDWSVLRCHWRAHLTTTSRVAVSCSGARSRSRVSCIQSKPLASRGSGEDPYASSKRGPISSPISRSLSTTL